MNVSATSIPNPNLQVTPAPCLSPGSSGTVRLPPNRDFSLRRLPRPNFDLRTSDFEFGSLLFESPAEP